MKVQYPIQGWFCRADSLRQLTGGHERIPALPRRERLVIGASLCGHRALGLVLHDLRSAPDACKRRVRMLAL